FLKRETIIDGTLFAGAGVIISGFSEINRWLISGDHSKLPVLLSTLDNPNPLGTVMIVFLFLAIGRFFMERGTLKVILGVYALAAAVVLFLSFSRGAWLGGGVGVVTFVVLFLLQRKVRLNWPLVIGLVVVVGLIIGGVTIFRGWNDNGRDLLWNAAIQMFRE